MPSSESISLSFNSCPSFAVTSVATCSRPDETQTGSRRYRRQAATRFASKRIARARRPPSLACGPYGLVTLFTRLGQDSFLVIGDFRWGPRLTGSVRHSYVPGTGCLGSHRGDSYPDRPDAEETPANRTTCRTLRYSRVSTASRIAAWTVSTSAEASTSTQRSGSPAAISR